MLPGWLVASRFVGQNEIEIVREDERIERAPSLCAVKYLGDLRSDQGPVPLSRPICRARTWETGYLEHVQGATQEQGVRRLEPE